MLAIETGWTLDYIDSLPLHEFNSLQALNAIHPFTYDIRAEREGLLVTEMVNSRRKKQIKSDELFPYLSRKPPEWLSDETVRTAKELIRRHETGCQRRGVPPDYKYVRNLIDEELAIERAKKRPDEHKIKDLINLLGVTKT